MQDLPATAQVVLYLAAIAFGVFGKVAHEIWVHRAPPVPEPPQPPPSAEISRGNGNGRNYVTHDQLLDYIDRQQEPQQELMDTKFQMVQQSIDGVGEGVERIGTAVHDLGIEVKSAVNTLNKHETRLQLLEQAGKGGGGGS